MQPDSLHFTPEDYQRLRDTYRRWWQGSLPRPIAPILLTGQPSCRKPSPHPALSFSTAWDFSISPEQFVDARDWQLSQLRFKGDAYPFFSTDAFGPGVLAAFMGCTPVGRPDTVWFQPPQKDMPIEKLHFELDEDSPYFRRVLSLYEAALAKWGGSVVLGMVDLGGVMDVLASFRGSENLLMDLYDDPEEVLRCVKEIQQAWFQCFDKINALISPHVQGYTQWHTLYSEEPSYILQSDFSYMISPAMFNEFIAPELASSAARIPHALYHMDGVGEIPHLDALLAIDGIKAIQWVPGAGEPLKMDWSELLARIFASGKKLLSCGPQSDEALLRATKDKPGQVYLGDHYFSSIEAAKRFAEPLDVEVK